ncbi:MAG TPA: hypothetical protein VGE07_20680 [Herpetosiphonaceae bacterium]
MDPIEQFIAGYEAADFQRIRFAWNGKEAPEGDDLNIAFRKDVLATVLHAPYEAPLELIRDLLIVEAEVSRLVGFIDEAVGDLATVLLKRGRAGGLVSFLHAGTQSVDAYYECLTAEIGPELAAELAAEVERMLPTIDDGDARGYLEGILAFFRSKII